MAGQSDSPLVTSVNLVSQPAPYCPQRTAESLMEHAFAHIEGLFSAELLERLQQELCVKDAAGDLARAKIGRRQLAQRKTEVRRDRTQWIEGETLAQVQFLEILEQLRLELNKRLMLGVFDAEAHYAVYRQGDFYARHRDSFVGAKNRLLSLVLYLNPHWREEEGGLLNLYAGDDDEVPLAQITPEFGHTVLFLSEEVPHEVTPVLTGERARYSIAAWFRCKALEEIPF